MKISITGGTGFLGTDLRARLNENEDFSYSVLERRKHNLSRPESLKNFVSDSDVVVHLAGVSRSASEKEINEVNVLGTLNLLDAISRYSPKAHLIFASSFQAYEAMDSFGKSKKKAEILIKDRVNKNGLNATILRFSNLYGVGGKPFHNSVINTFAEQIKRKVPITLSGDGRQKRDFVYISDASEAILLVLLKKKEGLRELDICTGKLTSLLEVVRLFESFTKQKVAVYNRPLDTRINFSAVRSFEKAKESLGWSPKVDLALGIKKLIKYYEL